MNNNPCMNIDVQSSFRRPIRSCVSVSMTKASTDTTFFFQAEDCIRDPLVTGVQTCALPISRFLQTARFAFSPLTRSLTRVCGGIAQSRENFESGSNPVRVALWAELMKCAVRVLQLPRCVMKDHRFCANGNLLDHCRRVAERVVGMGE